MARNQVIGMKPFHSSLTVYGTVLEQNYWSSKSLIMAGTYTSKSNTLLMVIGVLFICLFPGENLSAQTTDQLLQDKRYTFSVQSIQSLRGQVRPEFQSQGYYSLRVTPDSVISYLPFFGRAFTPSIGSSENGLEFSSVKFDYTVTDRKKGGWDILIKPKDVSKVQQLSLTIFPNGNASLQVISTARDPMSFQGLVVKTK